MLLYFWFCIFIRLPDLIKINLRNNHVFFIKLFIIFLFVVSARGKKRRKKKTKTKKHIKMMIPILIGALVTKALFLPIFLKALAFLSSSSFILSNLSLLMSMLIGIKLMVHNISKRSDPTKVEVHHVETTPVVHDNNNSWRDDWDRRLNIIPITNDFLNDNQTSYSYPYYPYVR